MEIISVQEIEKRNDLISKLFGHVINSSAELELFIHMVNRTGLDPFSNQIYPKRIYDSSSKTNQLKFLTGIDGLRLIAERSGNYLGQTHPYWKNEDGNWIDAWELDTPPIAARVGVYKAGLSHPSWGVALFLEYAQRESNGELLPFWKDRSAGQLAKCAEALALRKAFPQEMSGIYTVDEMVNAKDSNAVNNKNLGDGKKYHILKEIQTNIKNSGMEINIKEMISALYNCEKTNDLSLDQTMELNKIILDMIKQK